MKFQQFRNLFRTGSETGLQSNKKRKVFVAFLAAAISASAAVTATYAWFMISRTPIVSNLDLAVASENGLEIAPDENGKPGEWDVILDLSTVLDGVVPLRTVTYSKNQNTFYAMNYGLDGRPAGATVALSDAQNANVKGIGNPSAEAQGYYIAVTFWMRGSSSASIRLSEAKEVKEGLAGTGTYVIGNPVWNGNAVVHENGGNGLETALRLGFRCQPTDMEGNAKGGSRFVIYEPNADTHADGANTGYVATESINGGGLVAENDLIWQTTSSWNETTPVLREDVLYSMGEFRTNAHLFDIDSETMQKITMYVWLEGQDVDCINAVAAHETSIFANVQFAPEETNNNTGISRD